MNRLNKANERGGRKAIPLLVLMNSYFETLQSIVIKIISCETIVWVPSDGRQPVSAKKMPCPTEAT
jgi:hypothetical protein